MIDGIKEADAVTSLSNLFGDFFALFDILAVYSADINNGDLVRFDGNIGPEAYRLTIVHRQSQWLLG